MTNAGKAFYQPKQRIEKLSEAYSTAIDEWQTFQKNNARKIHIWMSLRNTISGLKAAGKPDKANKIVNSLTSSSSSQSSVEDVLDILQLNWKKADKELYIRRQPGNIQLKLPKKLPSGKNTNDFVEFGRLIFGYYLWTEARAVQLYEEVTGKHPSWKQLPRMSTGAQRKVPHTPFHEALGLHSTFKEQVNSLFRWTEDLEKTKAGRHLLARLIVDGYPFDPLCLADPGLASNQETFDFVSDEYQVMGVKKKDKTPPSDPLNRRRIMYGAQSKSKIDKWWKQVSVFKRRGKTIRDPTGTGHYSKQTHKFSIEGDSFSVTTYTLDWSDVGRKIRTILGRLSAALTEYMGNDAGPHQAERINRAMGILMVVLDGLATDSTLEVNFDRSSVERLKQHAAETGAQTGSGGVRKSRFGRSASPTGINWVMSAASSLHGAVSDIASEWEQSLQSDVESLSKSDKQQKKLLEKANKRLTATAIPLTSVNIVLEAAKIFRGEPRDLEDWTSITAAIGQMLLTTVDDLESTISKLEGTVPKRQARRLMGEVMGTVADIADVAISLESAVKAQKIGETKMKWVHLMGAVHSTAGIVMWMIGAGSVTGNVVFIALGVVLLGLSALVSDSSLKNWAERTVFGGKYSNVKSNTNPGSNYFKFGETTRQIARYNSITNGFNVRGFSQQPQSGGTTFADYIPLSKLKVWLNQISGGSPQSQVAVRPITKSSHEVEEPLYVFDLDHNNPTVRQKVSLPGTSKAAELYTKLPASAKRNKAVVTNPSWKSNSNKQKPGETWAHQITIEPMQTKQGQMLGPIPGLGSGDYWGVEIVHQPANAHGAMRDMARSVGGSFDAQAYTQKLRNIYDNSVFPRQRLKVSNMGVP